MRCIRDSLAHSLPSSLLSRCGACVRAACLELLALCLVFAFRQFSSFLSCSCFLCLPPPPPPPPPTTSTITTLIHSQQDPYPFVCPVVRHCSHQSIIVLDAFIPHNTTTLIHRGSTGLPRQTCRLPARCLLAAVLGGCLLPACFRTAFYAFHSYSRLQHDCHLPSFSSTGLSNTGCSNQTIRKPKRGSTHTRASIALSFPTTHTSVILLTTLAVIGTTNPMYLPL